MGMVAQIRTSGNSTYFGGASKASILRMLREGYDVHSVAAALGVPTRTVRRVAKKVVR